MGICIPRKPARRRACGGPRKRKARSVRFTQKRARGAEAGAERANPRGARGALHAKASGRDRAITASTSRLSCQSIGGRRLVANGSVALLARGTLVAYGSMEALSSSRKHIQAASRRRHPRQAHHRKHIQAASRRRHPRQAYHRFRLKKGSQPWRRRWLSFDAELPSWRGTPRARPHPAHRHRALLGCLIEGHCRARPQAEASRGLIPWLPCAG